jgi:hypothetical protein
MIGDLTKSPNWLPAIKASFVAGLVFLALSLAARPGTQELLSTTLSRFRRMRLD